MKNTQENATIRRYGCELRIYDNGGFTSTGGGSLDRYTMIPPRWSAKKWKEGRTWPCIFSSNDPRGCSGHGLADPGPHLGKRIAWSDLPEPVQRFARSEWPEFCPPDKSFYTQSNIGRAKYVVNYHNGQKQHKDGSPFFDIAIFSNKRKRDQFIRGLTADGYRGR